MTNTHKTPVSVEALNTAVTAARKAGNAVMGLLGKLKSISHKGEIDLVTEADHKAEAIIISAVQKAFPHHGILSEEAGQKRMGSSYRWLIDPLDGTTNFAHGFPFFSVSIALEHKGKLLLGVVFDPLRKEMFVAGRGAGAYLNGRPIHASSVATLKDSLLVTGFSYDIKKLKDNNVRHFSDFLFKTQGVRRIGSASLDMCYVASGRLDGFWEFKLNPWDTAAATLIVRESGGTVSKLDGGNFTPYDRNVVASNGLLHNQILRILTGEIKNI
jgi:myo-inositol-1(or 4)-monophosphatase